MFAFVIQVSLLMLYASYALCLNCFGMNVLFRLLERNAHLFVYYPSPLFKHLHYAILFPISTLQTNLIVSTVSRFLIYVEMFGLCS